MAIRDLVFHPDPILRKRSEPVDAFDDELSQLLDDLGESMYAHKGLGLAAPQIGVVQPVEHEDRALEAPDLAQGDGQAVLAWVGPTVPSVHIWTSWMNDSGMRL